MKLCSARSVLVGLALAGALVSPAAAAPQRPDPCASERQKLQLASIRSHLANAHVQSVRSAIQAMDAEWERSREAAYLSGAIDVGMMAGTVLTKPLAEAFGKTILSQALKTQILEAAIKDVVKEGSKQFTKYCLSQGQDPASVLAEVFDKGATGGAKKALQNFATDVIADDMMARTMSGQLGNIRELQIAFGSPDQTMRGGAELKPLLKNEYAAPAAAFVSLLISFQSAMDGAWTGHGKLETLRIALKGLRQMESERSRALQEALSDLDVARAAFNYCRSLHPESPDEMLGGAASAPATLSMPGHTGWILAVAFSPDGRTLASGAEDNTVRLWDTFTGQAIRTLERQPQIVKAVAFSPDGRHLAAATGEADGRGLVRIWNPDTGQVEATFTGAMTGFSSLAWAPNGEWLAVGENSGAVTLRASRTGAVLKTLSHHVSRVTAVAFSPDGRRLVSGSDDRSVIIWDLPAGDVRHVFPALDGRVLSVACSRDSRFVAAGTQVTKSGYATGVGSIKGTVTIWDADSGVLKTTLPEHGHGVFGLAFSPAADILAARSWAGYTPDLKGSEDNILFWDLASGRMIDKLVFADEQTMAVAFSPDGGRLAAAGTKALVRVSKLNAALTGRAAPAQGGSGVMTVNLQPPIVAERRAGAGVTGATSGPAPAPFAAGGKFIASEWDVQGDASIADGALRIDSPPTGRPMAAASSRSAITGDFDLRIAYTLDAADAVAGYLFQVSLVGRAPGAPPRSVRVARAAMQGGDFLFVAPDEQDGQAVMASGRAGTLRIERRGDEFTCSQFDEARGSWSLVGKLTHQVGTQVGVEIRAMRNGTSAFRMTVREVTIKQP